MKHQLLSPDSGILKVPRATEHFWCWRYNMGTVYVVILLRALSCNGTTEKVVTRISKNFKKIPNSFLLLQLAVKLRLSYALKTMSLEIFLSRFFFPPCCLDPAAASSNQVKFIGILANYARKNSWANPVCMKTFPTTFARLTVHHFTPMATLWTGPLWHSSSYTEIHLHIIIFFGRYEIVGPHNKYLSKPMNSW